mgnify:CR=1 FL=1
MFDTKDRRRVYWLIDKYLEGTIDTPTFSDEYHACYDLDVDLDTLSEVEKSALRILSDVAGRFCKSESAHQKFPGLYSTDQDVRQKAKEVKKTLADYWPPELQNH